MKRILVVIVLMVEMLAMAGIASSDIVPRTDTLFFLAPIPCHVYLKEKQSVESHSNYVADSFFQAKVQLLRMEPDRYRMEVMKKFIQGAKNFLQAELDSLDVQKHPEVAERLSSKLKMSEEAPPPDYKAPVFRVLETLEGPSPGEEIVISLGRRGIGSIIEGKTNWYMLGYQGIDGRIRGVSVDRNDLIERDDWFLTDLKRWVRRLFSECDNV